MDGDARYERPCKWLLAVAAGIHWVVAALMWVDHGNARAVGGLVNDMLSIFG